jgi:hypothetical protein
MGFKGKLSKKIFSNGITYFFLVILIDFYSENNSVSQVLGINDLFGTELAMIFSFHVGLTDSVMQRMQFFFLSVSVRHFLATALPDLLFSYS